MLFNPNLARDQNLKPIKQMQIETDLTKKQTHYLIDLLKDDYQKMRRTKEELLKIDLDFINEECGKTKMTMIEKLEKAMEENETICHKLDDHLTDISRGYKLNIDEEWKNNG